MSSDTDPMLLTELDQRFTLEIRMSFNLVNCRLDFRICQTISCEKDVIVAAQTLDHKTVV